MEDSSIVKRLIDFGIDEHEYDEVQDLPDESNINPQIATTTTDILLQQQQQQQQQPLLQNIINNNNSTNNISTTDLPPELPPPKQNKLKNSKKNKTKSKIPRSPSLASSGSGSGGALTNVASNTNINNNNNQNNFGSTITYSPIPPQTPPLPVNYQQSKLKHMNGGNIITTPTTPQTPLAAFGTGFSPVTPTTPTILVSNSGAGGNNNVGFASTPTGGSVVGLAVMGGGSVPPSGGAGLGANGSSVSGGGGGGAVAGNQRGSVNMASARRPQLQITPIPESPKHFQFLTLTVRKDENGYGMKVSGDNPVFVESVKPGGAAQIAGLVAGDMILKVNGQEVRMEKHPTVVGLIKASTIVELAVKRSQKLTRPSSVGIVPSTPILSGRDRTASITGPQPVDSIKRREMETYKIQTLQKMLEQERLNLERLKGDTNDPSYKLSEANIRKLREQLRKIGAEDAPTIKLQPTANNNKNTALLSPAQLHHQHLLHPHQQTQLQPPIITPQPQVQSSSPAFLSLLPRSLSSLSLGTRKNKIDKDLITAPLNNTTDFLHHHHHYLQQQQQQHHHNANNTSAGMITSPLPPYNMSQSLHQPQTQTQQQQQQQQHRNSSQQALFYHQQQQQQQHQQQQQARLKETAKSSSSKGKNKFAKTQSIQEDIPPPLPQRNPPRQLQLDNNGNAAGVMSNSSNNNLFAPISDLDLAGSPQGKSPQPTLPPPPPSNAAQSSVVAGTAAQKKRSKAKTKALSDPKMSTQMFLQMETAVGANASGTAADGGSCETDCIPPPLPPRQPGMLEESPHRGSFSNLTGTGGGRPPPNSIDTLLNYPLVSTCTPVHRDNMAAAFPLSQRPNIVQQLQQHQQQQQQQLQHSNSSAGTATSAALGQTPQNLNHLNKHRRVVSEHMHSRHPDRINKTTSGSWELVEKDGEVTPPGTPPPPYLTMSGAEEHQQQQLANDSGGGGGIFIESHHFTPLAGAASPTPPPLISTPTTTSTHSNRILAAQSNATQKEIISMEDEDASDQEGPFIDENGPFNSLQRLLEPENVAFLAVFLNYVLSNSEPAPLLFYLITGLYKEGTAKDMRKWAYEIHSTFLVPRAPLSWYRKDESLAREVDNVLQSEFDKVEILRKVFWKSRKCARDTICAQLREFQQTRTEGLGTIYGPTDSQLTEARGDKQREQHIFEETLMRKLQVLIEEYEKDLPIEDPRKLAICSALSTVIHRIFITRSHPNSIVDRVHHFVSREKSFKSRLMGKNRKMIVRGHPLVLRQYYEVTHCNHCQTIIWGVSPQGYHCTDCKLNIHRPCSKVLDENCPGPLPQAKRKEPHNDNKISKFMGKIRPRTSSDFISMEKRARHEEDFDPDMSSERLHTSSIVRQPSDRRPDAGNQALRSNGTAATSADNTDDVQLRLPSGGAYPTGGSGDGSSIGVGKGGLLGRGARESNVPSSGDAAGDLGGTAAADTNAQDAAEGKDARRERLHQHHQNKSAPVSVNRSESYKERLSQKRNRNSRRKTSDPSLTSRPNDEQADVGLSNSNYTASSNSSLSSGGGSESPSTSMEQMGGAGGGPNATASGHPITHHHSMHAHHTTPHHHMHQHSHQDSFHGSIGGGSMNTSFWGSSFGGVGSGHPGGPRQWNFESDDDDDLNEADWSSNVTAELLAALTDAEKKRQEIINEIYQTERSHVRILKLLERLFLAPLQESSLLTSEHLMLLFPPALLALRDIHNSFEQQLKQRRIEHNHVVTHIGDLLSGMFYGKSGEDLCQYAAQFCARQQIALEALKEKRRKDEQLQKLLNKAESHKACRRLQLKDLLPAVLQRLTKYPLLFENLYKVTIRVVPENTTEAEAIQRALESSKKILVDVNQAVKFAEDTHKLQNIQKKLDKSTFDKDEFKNLDLTQYRLIHDGSLTMKKNPSIQLHGLLFEDMIVLLTKQDDKYSLKYLHATRNAEVNNKPVSPIMSIDSETLVRQEAADKNSFFLIKTKTSQMLELRAPSSSECKTWFKQISDAAEQYKPRSKNANHEPVDDPAIATIPHSNTKESLELTPERPPPASAIATVTTTPLAPMMPVATATSVNVNNNNINNNDHHNVQLRNGRRESTPTAGSADHKMRLSHNELSPSIGSSTAAMSSASTASLSSTSAAVNRTMSTRSCGEPNNNNGGYENSSVTLRHTQSARQANGHNADLGGDEFSSSASGGSKRDSASIVYSNNSNNTRTLMQSSPPLVEPTAIQISISPAHTAEPVLTPAERLRRLDASIRDGLLEKQKIICDMFRLPVEHFHEIVDIAAMPEAPKDSADIALAAYAQVQSLTEVLNEYMHATHEQEVSAVSTAVCDLCHEKQQQQHHLSHRPLTPLTATSSNSSSTSTMNSTGSSTTTQIAASGSSSTATTSADIPPPLPPPNKQTAQQQTPTTRTPSSVRTVLQNALLDEDIHEDDDGYCEIDELRLPALPPTLALKANRASSPPPPLPPPAGSFKPPPLPPPPATATPKQQQQLEDKSSSDAATTSTTLPEETSIPANAVAQVNTAELVKRQSTISADSIPEESADEVTQALNEDKVSEPTAGEEEGNKHKDDKGNAADSKPEQSNADENTEAELEKVKLEVKEENEENENENDKIESDEGKTAENIATITAAESESSQTASANATEANVSKKSEETVEKTAKAESVETKATSNANAEEHMEVNDAYETLSTLNNKLNSVLAMVDNSTQTTPPLALSLATLDTNAVINNGTNTNLPVHCGPNRIQHANSLEPSVPCHALNTIVSSLNAQISLLLPKINERDMERERLRKENQHLRELLNAMHERQRVEPKLETPTDGTAKTNIGDGKTADETDGGSSNKNNPHTNNSNHPAADISTAGAAATASSSDDSSTTIEGVEGSSATPKITVNSATASTAATDTADSSKTTAAATESEN